MTASLLLRLLSSSGKRKKKTSRLYSPYLLSLFLLLSFSLVNSINLSSDHPFPDDILTPYPEGKHGSTRTSRDISTCLHTKWENRTVETFQTSTSPPGVRKVKYEIHKFADVVKKTPLHRRYAVGSITYINNPYFTLSVLEPQRKGTCEGQHYYTIKATVQETVANRKHGCRLAANAGYFTVSTGKCLGNIVSNGHLVQSAGGVQNANFGIKEDGTIIVGYIADEELYDQSNPFRQLVSGVVWLVRNGTNFVNESKEMECSEHEDTGKMDTFVDVVSARSAIGHDKDGRVVLARVEGQTHHRGANLYEFADILIDKGVVNAINLDGGGSNTLVENGLLLNYPSDHCPGAAQYRCPRSVSTILCVHDVECLEPDCSFHGSCDSGRCLCDEPWEGLVCNVLNCSLTNCSAHGSCNEGSCQCEDGWYGELCEKPCPLNRYGKGCKSYCYCYGRGHCNPVNGSCICNLGYHGRHCWHKCPEGYYGSNCIHRCTYPNCSGHGDCSKVTGKCICYKGWTGVSCNTTITNHSSLSFSSSFSSILPSPSSLNTFDISINDDTDCTKLTYNSSIPSPLSPSSCLPDTQITTVLIMTAIVTIIIHVLLCAVHILCCHSNSERSVTVNKAEIKRQLMERREWQQLVFENSHWTTSSDSEEED